MSDNFKLFIKAMNDMLHSKEFIARLAGRTQEDLMNELFSVENSFKELLLKYSSGKNIYNEFMDFIRTDKKTILSARIYFRERQSTMGDVIHVAFEKQDSTMLHDLRINYSFTKWVLSKLDKKFKYYNELENLHNKIVDLRQILCQQNLPLIINRAKIFWSRSISYHLEYIDLIQEATEALLTAVDKFCPPYRTVFRSVIIGRVTLNLVNINNATSVKLPAQERRILYRSNNAKIKEGLTDEASVLKYVKQSFRDVTPQKLSAVMSAASKPTSIDSTSTVTSNDTDTKSYLVDHRNVEDQLIKNDLIEHIKDTIDNQLTILEQKIINLKHGDFEWV